MHDRTVVSRCVVIVPAAARLKISNREPKVTNRNERKAAQGCRRTREWRQRVKDAKKKPRDQVWYYPTPLPDSEANKLAAELKIRRADDKPVSNREWCRLIGLVIAQIVKSTINK